MIGMAGVLSGLIAAPCAGLAQVQPPLVAAPSGTETPARARGPVPVPASAPVRGAETEQAGVPLQNVGDATRDLLALQADPQRSGTPHQVLGATAGRSWQRYLDSFEHAIPERFEHEVKSRTDR